MNSRKWTPWMLLTALVSATVPSNAWGQTVSEPQVDQNTSFQSYLSRTGLGSSGPDDFLAAFYIFAFDRPTPADPPVTPSTLIAYGVDLDTATLQPVQPIADMPQGTAPGHIHFDSTNNRWVMHLLGGPQSQVFTFDANDASQGQAFIPLEVPGHITLLCEVVAGPTPGSVAALSLQSPTDPFNTTIYLDRLDGNGPQAVAPGPSALNTQGLGLASGINGYYAITTHTSGPSGATTRLISIDNFNLQLSDRSFRYGNNQQVQDIKAVSNAREREYNTVGRVESFVFPPATDSAELASSHSTQTADRTYTWDLGEIERVTLLDAAQVGDGNTLVSFSARTPPFGLPETIFTTVLNANAISVMPLYAIPGVAFVGQMQGLSNAVSQDQAGNKWLGVSYTYLTDPLFDNQNKLGFAALALPDLAQANAPGAVLYDPALSDQPFAWQFQLDIQNPNENACVCLDPNDPLNYVWDLQTDSAPVSAELTHQSNTDAMQVEVEIVELQLQSVTPVDVTIGFDARRLDTEAIDALLAVEVEFTFNDNSQSLILDEIVFDPVSSPEDDFVEVVLQHQVLVDTDLFLDDSIVDRSDGDFMVRFKWTLKPPGPDDPHIQLDNLHVTAQVVPEPASLALLGLGGVFGLRRRQ